MPRLNNANLPLIEGVKCPSYDRSKLRAGIVHIGVGNFHRAHQAWYLHRLMEQGLAHDWAIIGAGIRPYDEAMRLKLKQQDYLTTLIELSPEQQSAEIVGSMIDYVPIQSGNAPLIKQMADPAIRIISTTITEGGYYIDPASKNFDHSHPHILYDAENPDQPNTVFGAMIASLKLRRRHGLGGVTLQSCDNLQGNGDIMRQTVISLARLSDPDLAEWIAQSCSFPNSMVDSIVPVSGEDAFAKMRGLGIEDQAPVTHENFRQWVIEDKFCAGRPPWEQVGGIFSDEIHAYERMKIRILNGGHQVIAPVGDLLGIETIYDTITHPLISGLFDKVVAEEIIPHVAPVPNYAPLDYVKLIKRRFANSAIFDTTRRVAFDGSSRQSGFILPSVYDCLTAGIAPHGLALISAIWARYCLGEREDGTMIEPNDPDWEKLTLCAKHAKSSPANWLDNQSIYGDLGNHPEFSQAFIDWLSQLYKQGIQSTIRSYLAS